MKSRWFMHKYIKTIMIYKVWNSMLFVNSTMYIVKRLKDLIMLYILAVQIQTLLLKLLID